MSEAIEVRKGLVGVYADVSTVSKVMPETNSLTYRGYPVQDLCENASFDETAAGFRPLRCDTVDVADAAAVSAAFARAVEAATGTEPSATTDSSL